MLGIAEGVSDGMSVTSGTDGAGVNTAAMASAASRTQPTTSATMTRVNGRGRRIKCNFGS